MADERTSMEDVFARLAQCDCAPRRLSGGGISAKVPGRTDHHPSLSVWESGGRVRFKDHAGRLTEAKIEAALGLTGVPHGLECRPPTKEPQKREVESYQYVDENGQVLYEKVRSEPKSFCLRRRENGKIVYGIAGIRRVLYRLPQVMRAVEAGEVVYICEGEKDVHAMEAAGVVATCNPCGAGKWREEYSGYFRGATVRIVTDKDEPGFRHAAAVQKSLQGVAASVEVIQPAEGKDAADHFQAGLSLDQFEPVDCSLSSFPDIEETRKRESKTFVLTPLQDLLAEPPENMAWVAEGLLPGGGLSMLCAKPKVGKSTLARNLALCVARGDGFFGRTVQQGEVMYFALEEKRSEVADHFRRMGAAGEPILIHVGSAPQKAMTEFSALLRERRPTLAIVDPGLKLIRLKDASDYAEVTAALEPLLDLARETGTHILVTHHLGKMDRDNGDAVLGSTALFGSVDTLLEMRKRDAGRVLQSIQRYGTDLPETVAELDQETGLVSPGGELKEVQFACLESAIVEALDGDALTEADIRNSVKGNTALIGAALRQLLDRREVTRSGSGRRGSPYVYALPDAANSPAPAAPKTAPRAPERTTGIEGGTEI